MGAVQLAENVYWVGAIDYDVRDFHGYKVPYGTTYNAYLVIDEKVTLIDTVRSGFYEQMLENITEVISPEKIDYIISNHVEPDHSGSLPKITKIAKKAIVVTCKNGEKGLRSYYKNEWETEWEFSIVKTGDSLCTGKYDFRFVQTPMIHWPDNMVTYMPKHKILFSNDAFGQHIASKERFDKELKMDFAMSRAADYYANIVLPFGGQVKKALADVSGLEISMIAPSHGIIWTDGISDIISKYTYWASNGVDENKVVIVYGTMWGSTEILANRMAAKFENDGKIVKVLDLSKFHISEVMTELLEARYICVGSPTLNRNVLPNVAALLSYMNGLAPKERKGVVFGSYGWSGESIGIIEKALNVSGFEIVDVVKVMYRPD